MLGQLIIERPPAEKGPQAQQPVWARFTRSLISMSLRYRRVLPWNKQKAAGCRCRTPAEGVARCHLDGASGQPSPPRACSIIDMRLAPLAVPCRVVAALLGPFPQDMESQWTLPHAMILLVPVPSLVFLDHQPASTASRSRVIMTVSPSSSSGYRFGVFYSYTNAPSSSGGFSFSDQKGITWATNRTSDPF